MRNYETAERWGYSAFQRSELRVQSLDVVDPAAEPRGKIRNETAERWGYSAFSSRTVSTSLSTVKRTV